LTRAHLPSVRGKKYNGWAARQRPHYILLRLRVLCGEEPALRARRVIISLMKAQVYVSLKRTVLDPQGKTIHSALNKMGYRGVGDVRQGKYFERTLDGALDKASAQKEVERIAREVLTNPVIEEF